MSRERARAEVDLSAIRHNAGRLAAEAAPAKLMAVVKADAYGHGAVPVARAALEGGASSLAVVTVVELNELRDGAIDAPVLLLGPLASHEIGDLADVSVVAWTPDFVARMGALGRERGRAVPIHLKLDTGMGRLGAQPGGDADLFAAAAASEDGVTVTGLMTHFATADELEGPNSGFFREQLVRFRARVAQAAALFPDAQVHAANSAAVFRDATSHFDAVRCGIALYGGDPFGEDPDRYELRPALSLHSWIAAIKPLSSRDSAGYGRHYRAPRATRIAIVPIGYGDGYSRALSGASVLIGGREVPVVGAVSMDQITVDLGPEGDEAVGEPVVLIGAQGEARITIEDLARTRGTINYEITCALSPRVRSRVHRLSELHDRLREPFRGGPLEQSAWIVGGALRDALAGREANDVDVVVDGDPEEAARSLCRSTGGGRFLLSKAFGAWRVHGGDLPFTVDITPIQGEGLTDDLARRDFTVNAAAMPIAEGGVIDPHGGAADFAAGRLRMVSDAAFRSDPVRLMRLVRLARQHDLVPDRGDRRARPRGRRTPRRGRAGADSG